MRKQHISLVLIAVIALSITSCKKRRLNRDTTSAIDAATIEGAFNDVQKVSEDALKEENLEGTRAMSAFNELYGDAVVTVTPAWPDTTWPKQIQIDFGVSSTDWLGRVRSGIINVTATGFYKTEGAVFTITPSNYEVNDNAVSGTKTIVNQGRNTAGNLWYSINVTNGRLVTADGDVVTWESQRQREWIGGESTTWLSDGLNGITDDTYSITGSANGTNRDGRDFTIDITSALIASLDCKWIKKGTIELIPEDLDTRSIDYGNGTCDNEAVVSIRNRDYTIRMW